MPAEVGPSGLLSRCSAAARGSTGFTSSSGSGVSTRAWWLLPLLANGVLSPDEFVDDWRLEAAIAAHTRPLKASEAHERAGRGAKTCWLLLVCLLLVLCRRWRSCPPTNQWCAQEGKGLLSQCRASWEQVQRQGARIGKGDRADSMSAQSRGSYTLLY